MVDVLGPGLIGPYFLVEFAVFMYALMTLRPGFPYLRVLGAIAGIGIVLWLADFLGPNWIRYLIENFFSFIGNRIASVV